MDQSFYQNLLTNIQEGIYFVDRERKITFWNKGAERISGFTSEEVLGKHCYDNILNHVDSDGNHLCFGGCPLHQTVFDGVTRSTLVYLHHKDGHRVAVKVNTSQIVQNGNVIGAVEYFTDESTTMTVIEDNEKLRSLAMYDQLTGLPNRHYLYSFLESKVKESKSFDIPFAIALLDIDHFKVVNDTYGHKSGDDVLQMFAKTCSGILRQSDIIARYGGEEFICIFPGLDESTLKVTTEKLRMLISNSALRENNQTINITVSIGATMYNENDSIEELIKRADELMYRSKANGRNQVSIG